MLGGSGCHWALSYVLLEDITMMFPGGGGETMMDSGHSSFKRKEKEKKRKSYAARRDNGNAHKA